MILCDVNVLVAAARPDHVHHALCRPLLDAAWAEEVPFAWSGQIQAAVVRLLTQRKIFPQPTPMLEALRLVEIQAEYPYARRIVPGHDHWRIFRELVVVTGLVGGATTDAWHAALAIEHGCEFWTMDGDFAKFPGLRLRHIRKA